MTRQEALAVIVQLLRLLRDRRGGWCRSRKRQRHGRQQRTLVTNFLHCGASPHFFSNREIRSSRHYPPFYRTFPVYPALVFKAEQVTIDNDQLEGLCRCWIDAPIPTARSRQIGCLPGKG